MSSLTDEAKEKLRVIVQRHYDCLADCQSFREVVFDRQVIKIQLEEAKQEELTGLGCSMTLVLPGRRSCL